MQTRTQIDVAAQSANSAAKSDLNGDVERRIEGAQSNEGKPG